MQFYQPEDNTYIHARLCVSSLSYTQACNPSACDCCGFFVPTNATQPLCYVYADECVCISVLFGLGRTRSQIHLVGDYYFTLGIRAEPRRKHLTTTGSSDGAPDIGAMGPDSAFSDDPLPPKEEEEHLRSPGPEQSSRTPVQLTKPSSSRRPTSGSRRFRTPRKSAKQQRRSSAVPRVLEEEQLQTQSDVVTEKKEEEEEEDGSMPQVHPAVGEESDEDLNVSRHNRTDRSRVISDSDEQEGGPPASELPQETPSLPSAAEVETPLSSWVAEPTLQSASDQELETVRQPVEKGDAAFQQVEVFSSSSGAWPEQASLPVSIPIPANPRTPHSYQPIHSPQYHHASPPPSLHHHHGSNPDLSRWADPVSQPQRPFIPSQSSDLGVQPMGFNPQSFETFGSQMQQPSEPQQQQQQSLSYGHHPFAPLPTSRVSSTAPFADNYPPINPSFPRSPFFRPYAPGYQPGQYNVATFRPPFDQSVFQSRFPYQFIPGQHATLGREMPTRWSQQHAFQQLQGHRHGSQSPNRSHSPSSQPTSSASGGSRYSISDLLGTTPNSTSATPPPAHQEMQQVQPPVHDAPPHFPSMLGTRAGPRMRGSSGSGGSFDPTVERLMQQQAARQWFIHQAQQMASLQRSVSPNVYPLGTSHTFIPSLGGQTQGNAPQDLLPSSEEESGPQH